MQECLNTKVKNMHQREILNLEKDFHSNLEKMKIELRQDIHEQFKRDINQLQNEIKDKYDEIGELKEIKAQLKIEVEKRDKKTEDLLKKIRGLEDQNQ